MGFELEIQNNINAVLQQIKENLAAANEAVGMAMEAHVKEGTPVGTVESTRIKNYHGGALRKSITHKVVGNEVYVGTNLRVNNRPYPVFVELGTGIYATDGKGRKSPWVWRDKNGKYHYTHGIKPRHFMRNALTKPEHIQEYKEIYAEQLKKG